MSDATGDGVDPQLFTVLTRQVLSDQTMSGLLDLVVNLALSAVEGVDGASVTVIHGDGKGLGTFSSSSPAIRAIDAAQYASAGGPCVQASRSGAEVATEVPTARWPTFSRRAVEDGVRSVTSLPLTVSERTFGALNLYSTTTTELAGDALRVARGLASQAAVVIANASTLAIAEMTNQQLQEALQTRDLIGQAKGILMVRQQINAESAFDILRRASQRTGRKLRDVASEVIRPFGDPESDR